MTDNQAKFFSCMHRARYLLDTFFESAAGLDTTESLKNIIRLEARFQMSADLAIKCILEDTTEPQEEQFILNEFDYLYKNIEIAREAIKNI